MCLCARARACWQAISLLPAPTNNNGTHTLHKTNAHKRSRILFVLTCIPQIVGKDGAILRSLGGSSGLKRHKNFWSFYRIMFMLAYEGVWYTRQVSE